MSNSVTVASIYPLTVGITRPHFTPLGDFYIKGIEDHEGSATADEIRAMVKTPRLTVIEDQNQYWRAPITGIEQSRTITAEEIARDLIVHATQNSPGMRAGCHPGVWICEGPKPTEKEIAQIAKIQRTYMDGRIQFGNELAADPKRSGAITWGLRVCAMAMGREVAWLRPLTDFDVKDCPYCTSAIPTNAVVCPKCTKIVNPKRYAELQKIEQSVLGHKTVAA